jgi:hypothetical protein
MKKRERGRTTEVLLLKDLAPRDEVKGGAGKRVFGDVDAPREQPERSTPRKRKRK